jgi:hypothetical protein
MAVKPESLDNRAVTGGSAGQAPTAAEQLFALRQRIRAASNAVGKDPNPNTNANCAACFQRGWMTLANSLLLE